MLPKAITDIDNTANTQGYGYFGPMDLQDYFNGRRYHHFRDFTIDYAYDLRVHADGILPEQMINERRPNETMEVKLYRAMIYIPKTKPFFSKIQSTLQKIRRSTDWNIDYKESQFDRIVENENLQSYCEFNFPVFGSITNWAFSLLLREYCIDANSLVLVAPFEAPLLETDFVKPVMTIFSSEHVIDFVEDKYAVLVNKTGCIYYSGKRQYDGESYFVITDTTIQRYDQVDSKRTFNLVLNYEHGVTFLPVFKVGGVVREVHGPHLLCESRISGIVPEFNEALREYSDLQAAKVLHLFPERWEFTQNECTECKGTGKIKGILDNLPCIITCETCQGHGHIATGPYSKMLIRPAGAGEQPLPTPPAGFVEKDVKIIELQEQSIKDHIHEGLASINFEFLSEKPLATSGVKTAMDSDEMNNTVHSIAEDIVRIMDKVYRMIAIYRYSAQYNVQQIEDMLPNIVVPEKFDLIGAAILETQLSNARKSNINAVILNALEIAFAGKLFNNDPEIAEHVRLVLSLDPLAGIAEADKMGMLSNKGITLENYIISSNINIFVDMAIEQDHKFEELDTAKQREVILKFAQDQIAAESQANQIINDVTGGGIDPSTGLPIPAIDPKTGLPIAPVKPPKVAPTKGA